MWEDYLNDETKSIPDKIKNFFNQLASGEEKAKTRPAEEASGALLLDNADNTVVDKGKEVGRIKIT
jgi:hypothetical protein